MVVSFIRFEPLSELRDEETMGFQLVFCSREEGPWASDDAGLFPSHLQKTEVVWVIKVIDVSSLSLA